MITDPIKIIGFSNQLGEIANLCELNWTTNPKDGHMDCRHVFEAYLINIKKIKKKPNTKLEIVK